MIDNKDICDMTIYIGSSSILFFISEILPFISTVKSNGIIELFYNIILKYRQKKVEDIENNSNDIAIDHIDNTNFISNTNNFNNNKNNFNQLINEEDIFYIENI